MSELEQFIMKVKEFEIKTTGEMIVYFVYYCIYINGQQQVSAKDIFDCFVQLSIKPYSNISSYLSNNSRGRNCMFIKQKNGYIIERSQLKKIRNEIGEKVIIDLSDPLLPKDILETAPYYIKKNARQMNECFEFQLFDAALVLMRKIVETLIIECFERYGVDDEIKDDKGNFYYLSDLIPCFELSNKWNVSRNLLQYIRKVKKYGDLSAHNRRFLAKKSDMNDFKFELRQVVQEIILMIDYPNWRN